MIVRLRFSIRLLLGLFAIVAIVLYVGYVRPTAVGSRFVQAVMDQDFGTAGRLVGDEAWYGAVKPQFGLKPDRVYAELLPREWDDVWTAQRRIILRVARHDDRNGGYVEWTEDNDVIAGPRGVKIITTPRCYDIML